MVGAVRATGHVQIKGDAGNRRYFALWRDADGRHQRLLGPARGAPAPQHSHDAGGGDDAPARVGAAAPPAGPVRASSGVSAEATRRPTDDAIRKNG